MDIEFKPFYMSKEGYDLACRIKELDGRLEFLKTWSDQIKTEIKNGSSRPYDGLIFSGAAGQRRLRVIETPATYIKRFDYTRFIAQQSKAVVAQTLDITPPKYPKGIVLGALSGKTSREWTRLALRGSTSEEAEFPQWKRWRKATPEQIARGLFNLHQRSAAYTVDKNELRNALVEMALEHEWETGMWGKDDGRLLLRNANPRYELKDREAAIRQYGLYVTTSHQRAKKSVGFYPLKETD